MLPAPSSLRETIMLFGHLRPKLGLQNLFARVNWHGVSRRQLIHAFLDRAPATAEEAQDEPCFDANATARALFDSAEFRADLAPRLLRMFADKRRLLFVHVPKAAGTDFSAAMRGVLPHVSNDLADPGLVDSEALARRLRRLARTIEASGTIFMGGHIPLNWFLDERIYRFQDRLVAILRHPRDICVSMANYILNTLHEDPDFLRPDTRSWAYALGLDAAGVAATDPRIIAAAVVTNPGLRPRHPICGMLGDGTACGTFAALRRAPVEITTVAHYPAWLHQNWGLTRLERVNAAPQVILWSDLSPWLQGQIDETCQEDCQVFEAASACLARTGGLSVTGPDLARFAAQS